jgi:hypothetical protein
VETAPTSGDEEGWPGRPQRNDYRLDLMVFHVNVDNLRSSNLDATATGWQDVVKAFMRSNLRPPAWRRSESRLVPPKARVASTWL